MGGKGSILKWINDQTIFKKKYQNKGKFQFMRMNINTIDK